MERGRGLIFGLAFSFVRIFRAFVLCPHGGPIVVKITNLVIFPLSFAVIFRTMRVGIVSLWIRINVSSWDEVAICGTMPSIINTYRIRMSIGYTLICDLTHVFRAFFLLFWVPGSFGPTLFPPEVSLLLPFFLFWPGLKACAWAYLLTVRPGLMVAVRQTPYNRAILLWPVGLCFFVGWVVSLLWGRGSS